MRQMVKRTLAVVLCLVFLAPTAWGRCKDYRKGHPWGDGTKPNFAVSVSSEVRLIQWRQFLGVPTPVFLVTKVTVRTESEREARKHPCLKQGTVNQREVR